MVVKSSEYLVSEATRNETKISQIVLRDEQADTEESAAEIRNRLGKAYEAMKNAAMNGINSKMRSVSGMTGGDAAKYYNYSKNGNSIFGSDFCSRAVSYALATSEYNASMGVIVAAPTAGSAGIMPGAFIAAQETHGFSDKDMINALLTAGGIGAIISDKASLAGAVAGCQAECGSAAAMTAAGLCELFGGTPAQCVDAAALALKNCLGLACDPVAGLVEVPCVKRNGVYTVFAITACDMALAGIKSFVPFDEVVSAMYRIGISLPSSIRETGEGGLAATPTGVCAKNRIFGEKKK